MNVDIKIGNLVKKPEMVQGQKCARMILAVNDNFIKKDGTRNVNYFNVIVWNNQAENCCKYLDKGSKVAIFGSTENRTYQAKDGTKKFTSEIIAREVEFLSIKKQEEPQLVELNEEQASDLPF